MEMIDILYIFAFIDTFFLFFLIAMFYFFIYKNNKKRNYFKESEMQDARNKQYDNYLMTIMGLSGADAITSYMLRNGKVFTNNESELMLVMTHEYLENYYDYKSVIRFQQPQLTSAYGLTYTELKSKKILELFCDENIKKDYFQSNYCMISELKERGTHYAVLFYLQSIKNNTPFGFVCLEYRAGEHEWKRENKSQMMYQSAAYDIEKIIEKICFLLEEK